MVCKYCKRPVVGTYIKALGAIWHPEHFLCISCGQPVGEEKFHVVQGQPCHESCFISTQAPRCAYCKQPLVGEYTIHNGQSYHVNCFQEHIVPRCIYCNKPLIGKYLIDGWGNKYCPEHEQQYPHCSFCSRLIPPQQQIGSWSAYGSQRCTFCCSTAIETIEQARPFYTQSKQWVGQQNMRFNQLPLRLELCDRQKILAQFRDRSESHPLGITLSTTYQNGHEVESKVDGIAILQGMPATLFAGVAVHELGHAWLVVQKVRSLPLWAEEGFCQLLSYRYYSDLGTVDAKYHADGIEKSTDPVYGEGFRRVYALSQKMGLGNVIETLRTTGRLPTG